MNSHQSIAALLLSVLVSLSASGGTLTAYVSPPGVQVSKVSGPGSATESFNRPAGPLPSSGVLGELGTYTQAGASIFRANEYGGACATASLADNENSCSLACSSRTNYLFVNGFVGSTNNITITLEEPARYLGFWWSAGDWAAPISRTLRVTTLPPYLARTEPG